MSIENGQTVTLIELDAQDTYGNVDKEHRNVGIRPRKYWKP